MNKHRFLRRPAAVLTAAVLIGVLSISALACGGGYVIYQIVSDEGWQVTYQINDAAEPDLSEDSATFDLAEQEPDAVFDYEYAGEGEATLVSVDGEEWTIGVTNVLTGQEPDAIIDSYEYTEDGGTVQIFLGDGDWASMD